MSGHSYTWLAQYYAQYMEHVDYPKWARAIKKWWALHDHQPQRLLEIAAGELSLARALQLEIPALHTDFSWHMLAASKSGVRSCADMRALPVQDSSFDSLLCLYDSINYMLGEDALDQALSEMSRVLKPGGMLIFDAVSPMTCAKYFGDFRDWVELEGGRLLLRHAVLDEEQYLQSNAFTLVQADGSRQKETHLQQLRDLEEWMEILHFHPDLQLLGAYANYGKTPAKENSERWHFVLKKVGE